MKKAAIIQSSYLPWKGYFDIIHDVDVFVFHEDLQYTSRDWRNRNRIKTLDGVKWITVPVKGGYGQLLSEAEIDYGQKWAQRHKGILEANYASAEYFRDYKDEIFEIYDHEFKLLSDLNIYAIKKISGILGIKTAFIESSELGAEGKKDDKVISICKKIGADYYLSGPAAKDYISDEKFQKSDISLKYKDYSGYPEYPQQWGGFEHHLSIIDLIFNCGKNASYYIWGWRKE